LGEFFLGQFRAALGQGAGGVGEGDQKTEDRRQKKFAAAPWNTAPLYVSSASQIR
jgi:hypothetical protein